MPETAQFRYAQARLQARLGARATDHDWRHPQGSGDLAGYLQAAGRTRLQAWINGLHAGHNSHAIELTLRQHYRRHVAEVAAWLPARWAVVVRALAQLPDLPALQHLLGGNTVPAWMRDDPQLRPYTSEHPATRAAALEASAATAWLVSAWQREDALPEAWYEHWRRLWPRSPRQTTGLQHLGQLLLGHLRQLQADPGAGTDWHREQLLHRLTAAFRRYSFQPAATCALTGIIALDLERLRADLVERALFAGRGKATP
ncbi:MAG: hypothetical protein PVI50_01705 [Gammaproteobacteria bacterium]|jgi:hypothetical protein